MSRLTAAGALSLLALCCFVQHGAAVNDSASSTGVSIAWAPSQKCDDSPGGNCALCNEFALQCLICLPGYGFNSHKACQNCRMGGLRLCLSCDLAMRPPKCLKCLGAPTSDIPYGWANPGYPTFMDAQGSCQKCAKVNDHGCLSCNMAGTACNACNDGFVLTGGVCKPCADPNCKKCRTNGKCIECVENTRGPSYGLTAQKTCKQCKSVGCERCSKDWRKCERCIDGIASVGQRGFGSNGAGACVRCKSSLCAKCQRDFRVCSQCAVDPLSLALPIKTPMGECKKCLIEGCAACSASGKTCAKCALGFIRLPSGQCEQLPKNCVTRKCLDCRGNKNVCRACAPQFYESSPNQCRRCINGCEFCDSGNGICKKCNPNAGLVGTKMSDEMVELLVDGARYGDIEDVNKALEAKVAVDAQDEWGKTALHMAAANGHADIVDILIEAGATVGLANESGNTALHWACLMGHEAVARLLLEAGASASALNMAEQTPVDEALVRGHEHIVALINTYSAQRPDDAEDVPGDEEEAEEEAAQDSEAGEAGAVELETGAASPVQQQQQQQQQQTIDPGSQP